MQFSNPTTVPSSFTVTGGTIDTVNNPVGVDPASTVAVVSTSVPFPFRDTAFWPCMSGESFPPAFGAGWGYGNLLGRPTYQCVGGSAITAITGAQIPRLGFNGKGTLTLTTFMSMASAAFAVADMMDFYLGGSAGVKRAGFELNKTAVAGQYTVDCHTQSGQALTVATFTTNAFHRYDIVINNAGDVTMSVDGVQKLQRLGDWPSSATDNTAQWVARTNNNTTQPTAHIATVQVSWT